jgi:hypothetical protein
LFLGQTELIGANPVNVHEQRRIIDDLMNVYVHRSRHLRDSLTELCSDLIILWIMAHHLNVNWRGQTRVKNLADDCARPGHR